MPRGDKSKYTGCQQRQAVHIADSYDARGVSQAQAEARAWATLNKQSGGGERPGGSSRTKGEAAKRADREDSARHAAQRRRDLSAAAQPAHADEKRLERLSLELLRVLAREQGIPGRSTMRTDQLIQALGHA